MAILKPGDIEELAGQLKKLAQDVREDRRIKMNDALAMLITRAKVAAALLDANCELPSRAVNRLTGLQMAINEYDKAERI